MQKKPWELNEGLKPECLRKLASIMRDVRHKAIMLHEPQDGDGAWSLGCRIYERTINKISSEAKNLEWLEVKRENLYLLILVNQIPIRFYSGSLENPSSRRLQMKHPEIEARQMWLFEEDDRPLVWRIAVDTFSDGKVDRITIAQFDEYGTARHPWIIPIFDDEYSEPQHTIPDSVPLKKPTVRLQNGIKEGTADNGEK